MNIWLVNPYGPIPGEGWRAYRFELLGRALSAQGHNVIWWTANFSHHFKQFRSRSWKDIEIGKNFTIRLVPTTGYSKNIGLGRLQFESIYCWNLYKRARGAAKPDCIVGTDPSQLVGFTSVKLANQLATPVVLDVFDLWPELFAGAFPRLIRPFANPLLWPFYSLRRHNLGRATAITALCDTYLKVATRQAPEIRSDKTLTVFNGIDVADFRKASEAQASAVPKLWPKSSGEVWVVFAGTLGQNYDIATLLAAARLLNARKSMVRIKIAGVGPMLGLVQEYVRREKLQNISYLGRLSSNELIGLYRQCDIGLCAYSRYSNVAMPDKAYDYLAAGLPILNSLRGELEEYLRRHDVGAQYEAQNPESLVNELEKLARDPQRRQQMGRNSYKMASDFDSRRQYAVYAQFVERISQVRSSNVAQVHLS